MAGQIPGRGSYIFEKTRALTLKEGSPCTLFTDRGQIIAKNIVISTHFPFYDKPGQYNARMEAGRIYTFAMKLNSPFPDGVFISAEKDIYSFRSQPYKNSELVIAGGQEHVTGQIEDTSERFRLLYAYVKQFFNIDHIEFCWSSQDNNTFDMVPYIGRYLPDSRHIYIATGFNGWGMTHGTISAIILNSLITGNSSPWQKVYDPSRFKLSRSGEKTLQETSDEKISKKGEKIIKEPENILSGMDVNVGKIIEIEGTKIAAYKTKEKEGIFLSPACTHMNCLVRFNDAEKSWDCPCHGSRFTFDGKVLNSPAIESLPVILDLRKNI
jgi:Rieske Fe-S protein